MKLCKDCIWHSHRWFAYYPGHHECQHEKATDIIQDSVRGPETRHLECRDMRMSNERCGSEGKLWEQRIGPGSMDLKKTDEKVTSLLRKGGAVLVAMAIVSFYLMVTIMLWVLPVQAWRELPWHGALLVTLFFGFAWMMVNLLAIKTAIALYMQEPDDCSGY